MKSIDSIDSTFIPHKVIIYCDKRKILRKIGYNNTKSNVKYNVNNK